MAGLKVLVCGGRDYADYDAVAAALDKIAKKRGIALIVHGGARGADSLAERWAKANETNYFGCPAKWELYGKAAGMKRNKEQFDLTEPDLVVAFPGGVGTAGMVAYAESKGCRVWKPVRYPL